MATQIELIELNEEELILIKEMLYDRYDLNISDETQILDSIMQKLNSAELKI